MKVRWLGHACFLLTADDGTKVLTDPFDESVGYMAPRVEADCVTVSHDHFDHNAVNLVKGNPRVIRGTGEFNIGQHRIKGIPAFHDEVRGAKRGSNTIYVIEMDGIRLCHLGDLGHQLTREQVEAIGKVDVLMVPVGGTYTVDAKGAYQVVRDLNPSVVIPMHYKTEASTNPLLDKVDKFLDLVGGGTRVGSMAVEITRDDLGKEHKVLVLDYA